MNSLLHSLQSPSSNVPSFRKPSQSYQNEDSRSQGPDYIGLRVPLTASILPTRIVPQKDGLVLGLFFTPNQTLSTRGGVEGPQPGVQELLPYAVLSQLTLWVVPFRLGEGESRLTPQKYGKLG